MNISPVSLQPARVFNQIAFKADSTEPQITFSGNKQPNETGKLLSFKKIILFTAIFSVAYVTGTVMRGCGDNKSAKQEREKQEKSHQHSDSCSKEHSHPSRPEINY